MLLQESAEAGGAELQPIPPAIVATYPDDSPMFRNYGRTFMKAVISGYHDTTGDPAKNEELSKQRAFAVRDALAALGIGEDKMELRKPADTTASGSNAEARRVEVTLE